MRLTCVVPLILFALMPTPLPAQQAPAPTAGALTCRALESYTDSGLKVTAIVFHQRNQAQQSQLAALLHDHSGEMVEIQGADGKWQQARMIRMGSCFGRGLLLLPASLAIPEYSDFQLRVPAATH